MNYPVTKLNVFILIILFFLFIIVAFIGFAIFSRLNARQAQPPIEVVDSAVVPNNSGEVPDPSLLGPVGEEDTSDANLKFEITGAEILLMDNASNRTGYDQTTSTIINLIPNSSYNLKGDENSEKIERDLTITKQADGHYKLTVIGSTTIEGGSDFKITVAGQDSKYGDVNSEISGTVLANQLVTYDLSYFLPDKKITIVELGNGTDQ